jgi:HEAT repeat protein
VLSKLCLDNPQLRFDTAIALAKLRDPRAFEPLLIFLRDGDEWWISAVIKALADLGDKRAIPPLIALLESDDLQIRNDSIIALGRFASEHHDPRALPPLLALLPHNDAVVQESLINILAKIGGDDVEAVLLELLHSTNTITRTQATITLAHKGYTAAWLPLQEALNSELMQHKYWRDQLRAALTALDAHKRSL